MSSQRFKSKASKKVMWASDTEDNSKGDIYLINFFDGKTHSTFTDQKQAIEFLNDQDQKISIWTTNCGYDIQNIFGSENLDLLEILYIDSRVIYAKMKNKDITFYDTLNHWKMSVEEMGKRINLPKLNPGNDFNNPVYCQRDTEITYRFVETMTDKYREIGAEIKATIGSTAMSLFQKKFYKFQRKRIFKKSEIDFMLKGYYGGRTEIFFAKPIEGNIQYFDFNSLYPTQMRKPMPRLSNFKFTKEIDLNKEGIVHVKVESPGPDVLPIPYLPYRDRNHGGLYFLCGRFNGYYTYFELREAQKLGYKIKKVYRAFEFSGGTCLPYFSYVETLYGERLKAQKEGDDLLSDSYKLLLNNLYGKHAQGNEIIKLIPFSTNELKETDTVFGSTIIRKEIGKYPLHTNVIWPAYVTAYARHDLYMAMMKVIKNNGILIYCDTDSVIFESEKEIFKSGKNLGELKSEGEFEYAHFKLPKLYKLIPKGEKPKYRTKGVPRRVAEEFFEKGRATFQRPYKIREVLRRNLSPKRKIKLKANFWDEVTKEIKKKYDKRKVLKKGFTQPITIKR